MSQDGSDENQIPQESGDSRDVVAFILLLQKLGIEDEQKRNDLIKAAYQAADEVILLHRLMYDRNCGLSGFAN